MAALRWLSFIPLAFMASLAAGLAGYWFGIRWGEPYPTATPDADFRALLLPPWETNFALVAHIAVLSVLGVVFWKLGWKSGLLAVLVTLVVSIVVRRWLPSPESQHFRHLILRSMSNRYADYIRNGDTVRAHAMKNLLQRAGVHPHALRSA
jgi:hypothetical protein